MPDEIRAARSDLSALKIHRDDDRPRPSRWGWILLVLVLLAGGGYFAATRMGVGARLPEVEVGLVRRVGASEGGALLSASGYILPERKADVGSRAFGRLEWVGIEVGSKVTKEEIMARLANADIAAQVEEAKASVADAEREFLRFTDLVAKGAAASADLDKADTTRKLAHARLKGSEAQLEYTLIRAPFDGIVVKKNAQVGEAVGPTGSTGSGSTGGTICTLVDRSSLEMVADVNEANIGKIKLGQKAEISADAMPDRKYAGLVRQKVPTADRQKGTIQVKVTIVDLDDSLLPEMSARVTFLREGAAAVGTKRVIAPRLAVREAGGRKSVFVLEGSKVRKVEVETGVEGEDGFEILKGLLGGEQVVTAGDPVQDGSEVRIKQKL